MYTDKLKIALIGYGKMGKMIDALAEANHAEVVTRIDSKLQMSDIDQLCASTVDVCIDFSSREAFLKNLPVIAKKGINMVVGTTGWDDSLNDIKEIVEKSQIGFLYASNFSPGVNIFVHLIKKAAQLFNHFPGYDVAVSEIHHNRKIDSPSGTALTIGNTLIDTLERKKRIVTDTGEKEIAPEELHISSLRLGRVPGTHSVAFDSHEDCITLTHQAFNREGFACGAMNAAHWLKGKKVFFTINDLFEGFCR